MKKFLLLAAILTSTAAFSLSPAQAGVAFPTANAYMTTNIGDFGTLNLGTGVFTLQGNLGLTLAGLARSNSTLYGVSYNNGTGGLYMVDPSNASLTLIGNSGITYDDFGSTSAGLYAVSTSSNLYSINASNGAATLIGPTNVGLGGFRSLSNNGSALYFSSGTNLYTLNTSTGAASLVGSTGSSGFGAMVFLDGNLLGGQDSPDIRVDVINPNSGVVLSGAAVTGTTGQFYGLAPVPEPATWIALLLGGTLVAAAQSRRRALRA